MIDLCKYGSVKELGEFIENEDSHYQSILAFDIEITNEILGLLYSYLLSGRLSYYSISLFSCYSADSIKELNIELFCSLCSDAITLNLNGNNLNDDHIYHLCSVVKNNQKLRHIYLAMNNITIKSVEYLFNLCRVRKDIKTVDIFSTYTDNRITYFDSIKDIYRRYYLNIKYVGSNVIFYPIQPDIDTEIQEQKHEFNYQYVKKTCVYVNYMKPQGYLKTPIFDAFSSDIFDINIMNLVFEFEYSFYNHTT